MRVLNSIGLLQLLMSVKTNQRTVYLNEAHSDQRKKGNEKEKKGRLVEKKEIKKMGYISVILVVMTV